jgi:hypothetical protein
MGAMLTDLERPNYFEKFNNKKAGLVTRNPLSAEREGFEPPGL